MEITKFITKTCIVPQMASGNKSDALRELTNLLYEKKKMGNAGSALDQIVARESTESTGIGNGIAVPHARILQIHLAGHTNLGKYIIDTHRGSVSQPVLDLYRQTIALTGPVSTLIEWDDEIPELPVLLAEAERARHVRDEGLALREGRPLPAYEASLPPPTAASATAGWRQGGPRESAADEAIG